jgi:protein-L-isoaspartate(D-aspartate) O-methyltransferase
MTSSIILDQDRDGIDRMIDDIDAEVRMTRRFIGKNALSPQVIEAMRSVLRKEFVPENLKKMAYLNGPLPIGHGQTISQPYIVALMTDLLLPQKDFVVLEIGTGSGYQAAVLSLIVKHVYSVEVIESLVVEAEQRLARLQLNNIAIKLGDGYLGWEDYAPYDGIMVTAAASSIPPPLIRQLKPGARLVMPVGQPHAYQELVVLEKDEAGRVSTKSILGVSFVPLTGVHTRS